MKTLLAVLVAAVLFLGAAVQGENATAAIVMALKACAAESQLSHDSLKKACEGQIPAASLQAYKCFTKCVQMEVGIMSRDTGVINPEYSAMLVPEEERDEMLAIARQCTGVNDKDLCQKSFSVDKCYAEKNRDMYKRNCMNLMKTVES